VSQNTRHDAGNFAIVTHRCHTLAPENAQTHRFAPPLRPLHLNARVPQDLRPLYGHKQFIRRALGTGEYKEAVHRLKFEAYRLDEEFMRKKRDSSPTPLRKISDLSDAQVKALVERYFLIHDKKNQEAYREELNSEDSDLAEALYNAQVDAMAAQGSGGYEHVQPARNTAHSILKLGGYVANEETPAFEKVHAQAEEAEIELSRRQVDRFRDGKYQVHDPAFAHLNHLTPLPKKKVTLARLLVEYQKFLEDTKKAHTTKMSYRIPCRILEEYLGEDTELDSISRDDILQMGNLLRDLPVNATQRYPGKTIKQAVQAARACTERCDK
jgi:hypothetical protein